MSIQSILFSVVPSGGRVQNSDLAEGRFAHDARQRHGQGRAADLQGVVLADGPDRGQVDQKRRLNSS